MIIMLEKMDIYQNPYIGVLAVTNERITLVPENTDEKDVEVFSKALETDVFRSNLGLRAGNSQVDQGVGRFCQADC